MSDATDTAAETPDAGAPAEVVETPGSEATGESQSADGFNEAWTPYAERLGGKDGMYFKAVQPLLAENDKRVNSRFEQIRNEYKPLEQYKDLGVDAQRIKDVMPIVDMLDADPVAFYDLLIQHPAVAAKLAAGQTPTEADLTDPEEPDTSDISQNPEFLALKTQNDQMMQAFQQQQAAEQAKQVDAEVESEVQAFRAKRPDYTEQDMAVLFNTIAGQHAATGKLMSFDEAAQQIDTYRDSLRSAPRPGSTAPLVMPTNGGAPSPNSAPKLGDLSSKQTQNLLATLLKQDANINP